MSHAFPAAPSCPPDPRLEALPRAAIVGAGLSGLACARSLRLAGFDVTVFDKGRRVGGRCSTRETPAGTFDHGALRADVSHPFVRRWFESLATGGHVAPWLTRSERADPTDTPGHWPNRTLGWVGTPAMQALPAALAAGLRVIGGIPVTAAARHAGRWNLHTGDGRVHRGFDTLVLALPAPQAAPLASDAPALAARLRTVEYDPCWTLMVALARPIGVPFTVREAAIGPIARLAADSRKPLRGTTERWVVQASARWSAEHLEHDADFVAGEMLQLFATMVGRRVQPTLLQAHRWRYAFARHAARAADAPLHWWDEGAALGVCGDSVVDSHVEAVMLSGVSLAADLIERFRWSLPGVPNDVAEPAAVA